MCHLFQRIVYKDNKQLINSFSGDCLSIPAPVFVYILIYASLNLTQLHCDVFAAQTAELLNTQAEQYSIDELISAGDKKLFRQRGKKLCYKFPF